MPQCQQPQVATTIPPDNVRKGAHLEVAWVPELADEFAEALNDQRCDVAGGPLERRIVLLPQEVVAQRRHVRQRLQQRCQPQNHKPATGIPDNPPKSRWIQVTKQGLLFNTIHNHQSR